MSLDFLSVIYQNNHFAIIDKPAGVLSVPGRFGEEDIPVAGKMLERQLGQKLFPVHRLDREVSGLLLFAKSAEAQKSGNRWFETKQIRKTYQALSDGVMEGERTVGRKFDWRSNLLRGKKRAYESPYGKSSITIATWVGWKETAQGKYLEWRLEPVTGRSHQLRYEMFKHGFTVVGDVLYGSSREWNSPGIALRSTGIDLSAIPQSERGGLPGKIDIPGGWS